MNEQRCTFPPPLKVELSTQCYSHNAIIVIVTAPLHLAHTSCTLPSNYKELLRLENHILPDVMLCNLKCLNLSNKEFKLRC